MPLAEFSIGVVMRLRPPAHRWDEAGWQPVGVLPWQAEEPGLQWLDRRPGEESYVAGGLRLQLSADENDGYFENWVAPEPKVFVMWQMRDSRAVPVLASVSYAEGTRMLDSGDRAEGLPMPPAVHQWLGAYLKLHYQPKPRRGRAHG